MLEESSPSGRMIRNSLAAEPWCSLGSTGEAHHQQIWGVGQGEWFSQGKGLTLYPERPVAFSLPGLAELLSTLQANGKEESRVQCSALISWSKVGTWVSASG